MFERWTDFFCYLCGEINYWGALVPLCFFMDKVFFIKPFFVLFVLSLAMWSCEKDDFIPAPTPTSVVVTGVVSTTSGQPLANVPVAIDYHESYYLQPDRVTHKAKGKTDSQGRYRLFFEPEADKGDQNGAPLSQYYYLCADLSGLPSSEYVMPGDFSENMATEYRCAIYKLFDKGETADINMFFPKKKNLVTEFKGFVAEKALTVQNEMRYGVKTEAYWRDVELDAGGNGRLTMPYSVDETNLVTVWEKNSLQQLRKPEKIVVNQSANAPVVFDYSDVVESCRFKLAFYKHAAFNGEEYGGDAAFAKPAPFDFLGFRIVRPDGTYDIMTSRYQYYDSIVWSCPDFKETYRIYDKKQTAGSHEESFISQWGSYFYFVGEHEAVLTGYKNGRAICSDAVKFELSDRDFLCFDWDKFDYLSEQGVTNGIYCRLDTQNEYHVSATVDADGNKAVYISLEIKGGWPQEVLLNWQQARLDYLMYKHQLQMVGKYDESVHAGCFKRLPADAIPEKVYENETTWVVVMHAPATDYNKEKYYLHAEPK